ncbi:DNA polymerase B region [Halorhabdus utahensis DSM 12940]|uniref:DNA polymerase n=1 Tax=Halorhabdus utahensis (strain DSM 12940 / JCM 11049 / AX-2) TaxID=519442 RepID=C7NRC5_HALUD|nr:DNA polymerase domain-containing protein [Halorhabdus utahensis]ACV10562.1 DNA polymerase B region [Halorhabdus utahensis DSM 12940]
MTDSGEQRGLGAFADDDRPAAEARAVAGNGGHEASVVDADEWRYPEADGTVELAVTQVDYTIEGGGSDEYPVVHVFGRSADGELFHVQVYEFRPYFYAPADNVDEERLANYDSVTGWERTGDDGEPYESIRGEELVRIFGQTPRDVGQIRDDFDHYEADILFPNRLLIDKDITSGIRVPDRRTENGTIRIPHDEIEAIDYDAEARVNTFDIEVDDRSGFPEDGEEPIICLTSHDSYRDEYVVWLYDSPVGIDPPEALEQYEPLEDEFEADVRVFEEEERMLEAFLEYIDETDPDILTGWNCLPADAQISMADGATKEIQDVQIGDTVVGNDEQETTVAEVTSKWESRKEVFEFELEDGTTLRSSGDHRIKVGDDQQVSWKDGRDIEPGEYVLKPRTLTAREYVPSLSELIPLDRQRFSDKSSVKAFKSGLPEGAITELSETFGVSKETLYHPTPSVWHLERCRIARETYDAALPDGGREYRRTGVDLDRNITEKELYLAGLVLTDGSMSQSDGVRFYNTRRELHEEFPGDNHLEPDGKGCYKQNVLDYAQMYALNGLGIPFGNKNERGVDLSTVYELPEAYIGRFLAGVVDGDGNVSSSVTVAAENHSIGDWYAKLFRRLGIYAERTNETVRVSSAKRDIKRFKQSVLPYMSHEEKVAAIEEFDGGKSGQSENIPYAIFEAETGSDEKRIGRDKHRRGTHLKRHETSSTEWEEYVFVAVENVEIVGTQTTYDIETTTHSFLADGCLVHNCDDFDAPYLIDRLQELDPGTDRNLDMNRLSRVNEVWESDWQGPDIKGRVVFDLLRAYKRTQFTELDSYRLEDVGQEELGAGKETYTGDIGTLWEEDPERLLEYNLRDVELCVELDRKQDIIAFFEEVATFVGCKLEDAPTPGDAVDMYVLHKAFGNFVLPSKGTVESGEEFEGGAVFEPISGIKEMVSVHDLKSLYPMCMVTINASPETKVDPETFDGETFRAPDPSGQHFRKEPDGIVREMVEELLSEREEKKSLRNDHEPGTEDYELYDRQQGAVKVIMNSLYGVSGWDRFRLYDKDNAAAVTATGRSVIEYTESAVNDLGYDVTYGDTDSVMISMGTDMSVENAIDRSFEIEEAINASYDEFASETLNAEEHRFQIEFEKLYRRFFQAGKKKRYAGHIVWKEGKDVDDIDITGFEYQRSDIAPITKRVQKEVLDLIVTEGDVEAVTEYLHDVIADFQAGNVDIEDVGIPGGIGKRLNNYDTDTAHVRGAKYANELLGTNFQRGSKPKRLYLKKVHPEYFRRIEDERGLDPSRDLIYGEFKRDPDVICFDVAEQIPEEFEVDWEKMLEKTLKGPIARVIEALNVSWQEVKSGQEQTGLGQYM